MPPSTSFISIPSELHLQIASNLDPLDRIALKLTCCHFHNMIEPLTLDELDSAHDMLSMIELKGRLPRRAYLLCTTCMRLCPVRKFDFNESEKVVHFNRPYRPFHKPWSGIIQEPSCYLCTDCAIKAQQKLGYTPGAIRQTLTGCHNQHAFIICASCNEVKFCSRTLSQVAKGMCNDCYFEDVIGSIGPWIFEGPQDEGMESWA